jgi:cell division FtsZ-interacting protein ZapD
MGSSSMDMYLTIKKNMGLLKKKRHKFKEYTLKKGIVSDDLNIKKQVLTEAEREVMKQRVQKIITKDRRIAIIRNSVILSITIALFIWLMISFFNL